MFDAQFGGWAREPQISADLLESQRALNHRFLELIASRPNGWQSAGRGLPATVSAQVARLSPAQLAAAANCPYTLFDLRFCDDEHWRTRLGSDPGWAVAEASPADPDMQEFVRLALFFVWHVARAGRFGAQLLLGMREGTVSAFRRITIDCIPAIAAAEAVNLTARWSDSPTYWRALTGAAGQPHAANLRRIQLYGLQLAAVEFLR